MRIYLAGPLFTPYERAYLDECAARLRADGFEVFVPHEQALALDNTPADVIFTKDWDGLYNADAVLADPRRPADRRRHRVRDRHLLRADAVEHEQEGHRRPAHRPARHAQRAKATA